MENKDLIIIALVILTIYFIYQQTQQKTLPIQSNSQELQNLKNQVQHYQTLYQKRVERDIGGEKVIQLKDQKITNLESSLLNLAKQKVKGQKDAKKILNELETSWSKKEVD
jgi:hypothetical protein